MDISSSVFFRLIIALLASFTLITIYYYIVFFLRNRHLLLSAAGSEESPWSGKGVDIESSSPSRSPLDTNNKRGENVAAGQKCAAECLSELEYGDAVRLFCSPPVCREKITNKMAGRRENDKIASTAGGGDCCDGGRGRSWTAELFWWAATEDCAVVI
ncbi:hypothetical protein KSP39_PZI013379 [Platanthera zijinensis]|uniref:Uncharacterized protein n=1 Tax=Platanthera zijinensis TaxID=2320716 RepID=A0AAP0BCN7_9ASPA